MHGGMYDSSACRIEGRTISHTDSVNKCFCADMNLNLIGNVEYGRKERDTSRSKDILIFCASAHTVRAPVTLSERNTQNPQPGLKTLGLNLVFK